MVNSIISDDHGTPPQPLPCRLTTYVLDDHGYGVIRVNQRTSKTHIEAYLFWVGPIPEGCKVTHLCNTPRCFEPTHLMACTQADNMAYMAQCGRSNRGKSFPYGKYRRSEQSPSRQHPERLVRGEQSPLSKLTEREVREIRQLAAEGQTHRQIAVQFGIKYANVSYIVRRKTWAHFQEVV
jgi:DNA-binding CsgD family transcriptional regulator